MRCCGCQNVVSWNQNDKTTRWYVPILVNANRESREERPWRHDTVWRRLLPPPHVRRLMRGLSGTAATYDTHVGIHRIFGFRGVDCRCAVSLLASISGISRLCGISCDSGTSASFHTLIWLFQRWILEGFGSRKPTHHSTRTCRCGLCHNGIPPLTMAFPLSFTR